MGWYGRRPSDDIRRGSADHAQPGLQIAEYGVDPLKIRQILRLAAADHGGLVCAVDHGDRAEVGRLLGPVYGNPKRTPSLRP